MTPPKTPPQRKAIPTSTSPYIVTLVKRLAHPHYVANVLLSVAYPAYHLIAHPEFLETFKIAHYSSYILPAAALILIKVNGSQSAEELIGVVCLYLKVYCVYGFWSIANIPTAAWGATWSGRWRIVLYLLAWLVVFVALPHPPYRGPSMIMPLSSSQLEYLTTPVQQSSSSSKGKGKSTDGNWKKKAQTAKIVELDENGDPIDDESANEGSKDQPKPIELNKEELDGLDSSHYWIIAFNATWSAPCRYFEAVLARCSIKYHKPKVNFGKIEMDMLPDGDSIAGRFNIDLGATTIDLPTLILFKDGEPIERLPPKIGTTKGGTLLGKVGWDRSERSVVTAFELDKLGTGKESFVKR
ncbi:Thioredoxin- transmembrane protein 2 [Lunasporangiospora selenospora]|uniref:Thioredoxin- transmembrane protein 2 n=1 Tax=Lunasporangiospora selenospora TaxID=979761 RepID=A0A9P6FWD9_9FUNG|nr:Thioredoxin- transmembrane protein 2 [Lunasporangiospora selenospora]